MGGLGPSRLHQPTPAQGDTVTKKSTEEQPVNYGEFKHPDFDGSRFASTPAEAVAWAFDGWKQVGEPTAPQPGEGN